MRVFLVEPHEGIRRRLKGLLSEIPGLEVIGEARGVPQALEGIRHSAPELVVSNLELSQGTGLDIVTGLRGMNPPPRVILVMDFGDGSVAQACVRAGADFCLYRHTRFEELCQLVQSL